MVSLGKTEEVYRELRRQIESLELAPGTQLSEVTIGERLGASRTPVREAIRQLAREDLVDFIPGKVARVSPISVRGVRGLFEFRMILEPAAARMVTEDGRHNPALLAPFLEMSTELAAIAREFDAGVPRSELAPRFYELTERFDQSIIAACHNKQLASTIADRRGQTARLRGIAHSDRERMSRSLAEHLRMCRAILDGEPEQAATELSAHLAETLRTILDNLTRDVGRLGGLDMEILPLG